MEEIYNTLLDFTRSLQETSARDNSVQLSQLSRAPLAESFGDNLMISLRNTETNWKNEQKQQELRLIPLQPYTVTYCPYSQPSLEAPTLQIAKNVNQQDNCLVDDEGNAICNFHIVKIELICDTEGNTDICFEIVSSNSSPNTRLQLELEKFREGLWYKKIPGLSCFNITLFKRYLEKICEKNSRFSGQKFPCQGWYKLEDSYRFVTPNGFITRAGKVFIENDHVNIFQNQKAEYDNAQLFWDMRDLTSSPVAKIVMVYTIMASLFTLLKSIGFPPAFLLGIVGPRSCQKTSLALVMANLYDRKAGMRPLINFSSSTQAGLQQQLRLFKDSVMIIDDLKPSSNATERKKVENNLEQVVRLFGDNVGTTKNTDFLSKEKAKKVCYIPEGLCLFTGEYSTGVASSLSRCVILGMQQGDVNKQNLTFYQKNLDILPAFLWSFLYYVETNQATILPTTAGFIENRRLELQNSYNVDRFSEYQSQFEAVFDIFLQYLYHANVLTAQDITVEMQLFQGALYSILHANQEAMEANDPIKQIIQVIHLIFYENAAKFCDLTTASFRADYYTDSNYVYLHCETFFNFLKKHFEAQGISCAIIDVPYMKSVLDREKYLCPKREAGQLRKSIKIPSASSLKENRRFLRLKREVLHSTC